MQWSGEKQAGFTTGEPWLPIAEDYRSVNVNVENENATSMLNLYRRLIRMRRAEPALAVGDFAPVPAEGDLMAYVRKADRRRLLIVLNLGPQPQTFNTADLEAPASLLLSTHLDRGPEELVDPLELRPDEGVIIELR
jgi:alpha-glucosidase